MIIFDEIDAICKQRGSMAGSTGVHDTVVNQLLSKMDGVEQLNNILVIGVNTHTHKHTQTQWQRPEGSSILSPICFLVICLFFFSSLVCPICPSAPLPQV